MKKVVMEIYTIGLLKTIEAMAKRKGCLDITIGIELKEDGYKTTPVPVIEMYFKTETIAENMLKKIEEMELSKRILKLE